MSIKLGIYEKAYAAMAERLAPLRLDLDVHTFDGSGRYTRAGRVLEAGEVDLDYMWLSPMISADKQQEQAFATALATRRVGVLQTFNAGIDHPFYKAISAKGTRISNSSAQSVAISEYVITQVLSVLHPVAEQRALQASRTWRITPFREIAGTRWLIVGYGPIGRAIAKRAKAFDADVTVIRRQPTIDGNADRVGRLSDLATHLPTTDVVVLACPLNSETRGLANAAFFAALKRGAMVVNIARGGVVEDGALLAALDRGQLETAILDVFHTEPLPSDDPLWDHPKVRVTSHTSFSGSGVRGRWDQLFLDNIARFARGEPLLNEVAPGDI